MRKQAIAAACPRPDQVSAGTAGFRYLGKTFGSLRRGRSSLPRFNFPANGFVKLLPPVEPRKALSSCCFSTTILEDNTVPIAHRGPTGRPGASLQNSISSSAFNVGIVDSTQYITRATSIKPY